MSALPYADLHCHSHYSDGTETTDFLVQAALERGVTHLALTDHDCMAGVEELWSRHAEAAEDKPELAPTDQPGLRLLAGVEISCDWHGLEIHVVGLLRTPDEPALTTLLMAQQERRASRAVAIGKKLEALAIRGLSDHLAALPAAALTRSHVADFLVESGHCKDKQKAFKTHLGKRGKAYVAAQWCSLGEAIAAIDAAGGIAVLAHPSRYALTRSKLSRLLGDFSEVGGSALEVSYGNLDPLARRKLIELAEEFSLFYSCGSDFHTAKAQWTALGKFPKFEPSVAKKAIWEHPRWLSIVSAGRVVAADAQS